MLRELAVFLCFAGTVFTSQLQQGLPPLYNVATQSPVSYSAYAPTIEVSSVQRNYDIPLEAKILRSQLAVGVKQPAAYTSQEYVPKYQEYLSEGRYVQNPVVVKTVAPAENKVTIEAHQQVTAHPPTANHVSSQSVPVAVQPVKYVQTDSNPAFQYAPIRSVTALPPTATFVSSRLPPLPIQNVQTAAVDHSVHSEVVSFPVGKKFTVEAHQSVTAHPPTAAYVTASPVITHSVQHPTARLIPVPVQSSFQFAPPPPAYVASTAAPLHVSPTVPHSLQVVSNTAYETVRGYPPPAAYITKPVPVKESSASGTVTIESQQSVTAHRPTSTATPYTHVETVINPSSVQYVSAPVNSRFGAYEAPSFVHQATPRVQLIPSPIVSKSIPVPVYFPAEEPQKYVAVPKYQVPQPISVPVLYPKNEAYINYRSKVSSPVVYTADSVATPVISHSNGYAKAFRYSPASAVSSVRFNGLGVSYGW